MCKTNTVEMVIEEMDSVCCPLLTGHKQTEQNSTGRSHELLLAGQKQTKNLCHQFILDHFLIKISQRELDRTKAKDFPFIIRKTRSLLPVEEGGKHYSQFHIVFLFFFTFLYIFLFLEQNQTKKNRNKERVFSFPFFFSFINLLMDFIYPIFISVLQMITKLKQNVFSFSFFFV